MKRFKYKNNHYYINWVMMFMKNSRGVIEKIPTSELMGSLNEVEEKYAPTELYIFGKKSLVCENRCVSIIGTRNPTKNGIENAQQITKFLVKNNVTIVSGLAKGIDSVAHRIALENKGNTIAVLGTPLDQCYPKENKLLFEEIKKNHLVISQFNIGSPVYPSNFPKRNRTMALISQASIIVEAGEKSGTMHQGWEALRLGRQLFIVEDLVKNENFKWVAQLIEYGAEVLPMDNLDIILEFLPDNLLEGVCCVNF
jgi:DNA processing protein